MDTSRARALILLFAILGTYSLSTEYLWHAPPNWGPRYGLWIGTTVVAVLWVYLAIDYMFSRRRNRPPTAIVSPLRKYRRLLIVNYSAAFAFMAIFIIGGSSTGTLAAFTAYTLMPLGLYLGILAPAMVAQTLRELFPLRTSGIEPKRLFQLTATFGLVWLWFFGWFVAASTNAEIAMYKAAGRVLERLQSGISLPADNLFHAAGKGDLNQIRSFLNRGTDVNAADEMGRFPIHYACSGGQPNAIRMLHEAGANVDARDAEGALPLFWAARSNQMECIEILLSLGTDTSARDKNGDGVLHYAVRSFESDSRVVYLLGKFSVDPNVVGRFGTPLLEVVRGGYQTDFALDRRRSDMVRALLDIGADPDVRDGHYNRTPLHFAAMRRDGTTTRLLLNGGADRSLVDSGGETPLSLITGHCDAASALKEP